MNTRPGTDSSLDIISPMDGSIVHSLTPASAADVDRAVQVAVQAQKAWIGWTPERRSQLLWDLGALVEKHSAELARLDTTCTGKVLRDSLNDARRDRKSVV